MHKKIKLQQREYIGADGITKYKQCRVNIPESIIQKMEWNDEQEITIHVESTLTSKKKKKIILTARD